MTAPALNCCFVGATVSAPLARNAYNTYRAKVGGRKFLVTMEEPNASKPEPLTFEVAVGGVTWIKAVSGAPAILGSKPPRAGLETRPARAG